VPNISLFGQQVVQGAVTDMQMGTAFEVGMHKGSYEFLTVLHLGSLFVSSQSAPIFLPETLLANSRRLLRFAPAKRSWSIQLGVFGLSTDEYGDVAIGILPEPQEFLIRAAGSGDVAL